MKVVIKEGLHNISHIAYEFNNFYGSQIKGFCNTFHIYIT